MKIRAAIGTVCLLLLGGLSVEAKICSVKFQVDGWKTEADVAKTKEALEKSNGVTKVTTSPLKGGECEVEYDSEKANPFELTGVVRKVGFTVGQVRISATMEDMMKTISSQTGPTRGVVMTLGTSLPAGTIHVTPEKMVWKEGDSALPAGAKITVLEGDPKKEGWLTMRIKLPPQSKLLPHTHPVDERVTVISGSVGIAFGDHMDQAQLKRFDAGSYYKIPAGARHYVWAGEEGAELQATGMGPWGIEFHEPKAMNKGGLK